MPGRRRGETQGEAGRRPPIGARLKLGAVAAATLAIAGAIVLPADADDGRRGAAPTRLAQGDGKLRPHLTVRPTVVATPAGQTPIAIRIAPAEAVPRNSFLQLRGLPPSASVSPGHAIAPGAWAVPINGLPGLTLSLPASVSGRAELVINLVSEDGQLLDQARIALVIQPGPAPAAAAPTAIQPSPPPPVAQPPAPTSQPLPSSPADLAAAEKLAARGDRELEQGNIAQARQFYQRAAQMGLARGALMLGATYDPQELARLRAVGVVPNVAEARKWYERALELGAPEAKARLANLGGGG